MQFGQFTYSQWLIDIGFLVCSLGVSAVIARYLAEFRHDSGLLASFARLSLPIALAMPLVAGATALFGMYLSGMVLSPLSIFALFAWASASGMWAMQTAALSGLQRFDKIFVANIVASIVMLSGASLVPHEESDIGLAFLIMAASGSIATLVGMRITISTCVTATSPKSKVPWKSIRAYAINIWLSGLVANLVWSRGELPVVRATLGDVSLAHYSAALAIFGGAVQGVMLCTAGVSPHIARLWGESRIDEAVRIARTVMDLQLALSGLGSLVIVFLGPQILSMAFTKAYSDSSAALAILCLGLLSFVVSSQSQLLLLKTDARFNRNIAVLGLVLLYTFAFILIPAYGLVGAAIARSGTMVIIGIVTLIFVSRYWGKTAFSLWNVWRAAPFWPVQ